MSESEQVAASAEGDAVQDAPVQLSLSEGGSAAVDQGLELGESPVAEDVGVPLDGAETKSSKSSKRSSSGSSGGGGLLGSSNQEGPVNPLGLDKANARGLAYSHVEEFDAGQLMNITAAVPRLDDLIVKTFAENYDIYPAFHKIPPEYIENVVALLDPTQIEFAVAAKYIPTEIFWRRLCLERWPVVKIEEHGMSFKRFYVENHIQHLLESYYPSQEGLNHEKLLVELKHGAPYVHTLRINQLLSHVDLAQVLGEFSHLSALHLTYGARKLGMDYDKALFGMNHADAMTLSKFVRRSDTLTTLRLVENVLNDESIQILMSGFQQNYTITSLDLSHNRIDDVGATRLAALLDKNRVMSSLKLYNNQIGPKGAEALGQALAHSNSLLHFDIALNPLGEKGGKFILEGAEFNKSLRSLSLAGCDLGPRCSQGLGTLLIRNKSLTYLDLTSNALPDEAAEVLTHAISKFNTTLLKLDCRRNDMALEATADFQRLLKSRFAAQKRIDRKAYQDGWDEAL